MTTAIIGAEWQRCGVTREVFLIGSLNKPDSFGWLDGRIVAVDYGN